MVSKIALPLMMIGSLSLAGCVNTATGQTYDAGNASFRKVAVSGQQTMIWSSFSANSDCSGGPVPITKVLSAPAHGRIYIIEKMVHPTFAPGNPRYKCNSRAYKQSVVYYTSVPGYTGEDSVKLSADFRHDNLIDYANVGISVRR